MDLRVWKWRSPWEKRNYLLCAIFYTFLLLQDHVTAADAGYSQESKNEIQDSNKIDSLSNYLPYDSTENSDYKRASGFYPLRGKKPSSSDSLANQLLLPPDTEGKRSQFFPLRGKKVPDDLKRASYFMPMRGKKEGDWIEDEYDVNDENPYKRASAFMPMRGKKKYEAISNYLTKAGTYSNDVSEVLNPPNSLSYQSADKRMHSFVPVRGKRSYKDKNSTDFQVSMESNSTASASNHSIKKRASSFMPMRGRKDFEQDNPGKVVTSLLEKKKHSFMPMRGRRGDGYDEEQTNFDKKATFMPMRGRRYDEDSDNSWSESDYKRAQSFMPMRGRRAQLRDVVYESSDLPEMESKLIEDKRASSFMPMRGRRSPSEIRNSGKSYQKKASAFTLMRGRRSTDFLENEEFSKDSLDLEKRPAFMSMRGRRLEGEDATVEPWPADQLMSLLDKKSSSFLPMRGRRLVEENVTVEPWQADQLMSLFNKKISYFMPMRGRRFDDGNYTVEPWQADQLMSLFNKKSPYFMPMRGRRFDDENYTVEPWQADQLMSLFNKKSSSFLPMRGRRTTDDGNFTVDSWPPEELMSLFNKKSSSFMPMRGRRDSWDYPPQNYDDKRSSNFMPMRGRRLESRVRNFYNPYPYLMGGIGSSMMSKPFSDQGVSFNSVRSANDRRNMLRINWDAVKRAFHATRGKRSQEIDDLVHSLRDSLVYGLNPAEDEDRSGQPAQQSRSKRSIVRSRVSMQPNRQYLGIV